MAGVYIILLVTDEQEKKICTVYYGSPSLFSIILKNMKTQRQYYNLESGRDGGCGTLWYNVKTVLKNSFI